MIRTKCSVLFVIAVVGVAGCRTLPAQNKAAPVFASTSTTSVVDSFKATYGFALHKDEPTQSHLRVSDVSEGDTICVYGRQDRPHTFEVMAGPLRAFNLSGSTYYVLQPVVLDGYTSPELVYAHAMGLERFQSPKTGQVGWAAEHFTHKGQCPS